MKKRILSFIIAMALILSFTTGCQKDKDTQTYKEEEVKDQGTKEEKTVDSGKEFKTDVLVIGGGGTGLVAALKAAEKGASVILVEKQGVYGGATSMSSGKIPAFGTKEQKELGIIDSKEDMLTDIYRAGLYTQNYELLDKAVSESNNVKEWMEKFNIKWNLEVNLLYQGQSIHRIHVAEGGGGELVNNLVSAVEKNENIISYTGVQALDLITDNDKVIGAILDYNGKTFKVLADSTVLATSGFGANREMVEKYIPSIKNAVINVAPGATGEGIEWGKKLGAGTSAMSAYQAYAPISLKTHKSLGGGYLNNGGILLNKEGRRFIDEYIGYSPLGTAIVNQPDSFAFMIWDENVQKLDLPSLKVMESDELIKANNTAELSEKLNIPLEILDREIKLYQDGIKNGEDYMNRTKLPKEFKEPFYAIKVTGDFRHTQGGLIVNPDTAQVLKENKLAIPNLYAGGGVIEGFSSNGDANYMAGNGLLQAFVFGNIAGDSAAENSKKEVLKDFKNIKSEFDNFIKENKVVGEKSSNKYNDGEYEAVGKGHNGDIKLKVIVENNEIKDVLILENSETKGISDAALEEIPELIKASNQYEKIDIVSGATKTSEGILEAVKSVLEKEIIK